MQLVSLELLLGQAARQTLSACIGLYWPVLACIGVGLFGLPLYSDNRFDYFGYCELPLPVPAYPRSSVSVTSTSAP